MNFLQPRKGDMEVLSKEKMKQIVGGVNQPIDSITVCRYTCNGPGTSYVIESGSTCPESTFEASCFSPDDDIVFCECDFG